MSALESRAVRFHELGQPLEVLTLDTVEVADPPADGIRVRVLAAGLNPADGVLCLGFMPGELPRGIGYDVAGIVESVGADVSAGTTGHETVQVGDLVFGTTDLTASSAGIADVANLQHWARIPESVDPVMAGALPMVVQTAALTLELLRMEPGQTLLVHGAGGMVGYSAVQFALAQGLNVVATAGTTYAADLEEFGAKVTPYGQGMAERVRELTGGRDVDAVLDVPRPNPGVLSELIGLAGGDPKKVITISNHDEARELGARVNVDEMADVRTTLEELLPHVADMVVEGTFRLPIAQTFPLSQWREGVERGLGENPRGKVVFLPREG